MTGTNLNTKI